MADLDDLPGCCGIGELIGIGDHPTPVQALNSALGYTLRGPWSRWRKSHLIFSQAGGNNKGYGYKLAAYIRKHNLGTVTRAKVQRNPNTGREIHAFIWAVNVKALKRHMKTKTVVAAGDDYIDDGGDDY